MATKAPYFPEVSFVTNNLQSDSLGEGVCVLLGAGRSGTTLLYKLLAMHRQVAYVSNYVQKAPAMPWLALGNRLLHRWPMAKRRAWFLEEGGAYMNSKRVRAHALVPTPFEGEALYRYCGVPLTPAAGTEPDPLAVARLRRSFMTMRRCAGGATIMTKRTANNRRVAWLDAAFPRARYIHLVRDGRAVAYSLLRVNWWDDHTLFWAGTTPRQLTAAGADPLQLASRNWVEEMSALENGIAALDARQVMLMRYEDLLVDPIGQVRAALDFIGVAMDSDVAFRPLLEGLNLSPRVESWTTRWTSRERDLVEGVQGSMLSRWGYGLETSSSHATAPATAIEGVA